MELKAKLEYPYSETEKMDFIIQQNHVNGYEIRNVEREIEEIIVDPETGEETTTTRTVIDLEAWGYTEEEKAEQERNRKDNMTLTPADVWRALYKAKQMRSSDLLTLIEEQLTGVDMNLVEIEFGASSFYRGAQLCSGRLFDVIGNLLGYTSDDMDYLFEHKELPEQEEINEENVEQEEINEDTVEETEQETVDYSQYTVAELKAIADERGLTFASNILKADLIALLETNE